jgi:hypothetical protein
LTSTPAAGQRAAVPAAGEPSWARVLATTIELWISRRLRSAGFRPRRVPGQPNRNGSRQPAGHPRERTARRWQWAGLALALMLVVVAVLQFTGVFTRTAAPGERVPTRGSSPAASAHSAGAHRPSGRPAVTAAQSEAAVWIAGQVSGDAIIACDPVMCAALQAQGITAGRLLPLRAGPGDPVGADVLVTSHLAGGQLAEKYAPAVIASFGSGSSRIDVRAIVPGGSAAYASALRADLAARQGAGSQLLRNERILVTTQDAAQLRAGEVDSRLLATLAALSSQYSLRVTGFGDAAPGAAVLFRAVTITVGRSASDLSAALASLHAQHPPYLPAYATIIHPAGGQPALSIQFAAPSPLGLLSAVLSVYSQPALPTARRRTRR